MKRIAPFLAGSATLPLLAVLALLQTATCLPAATTARSPSTAAPTPATTPPLWSVATADTVMKRYPDFARGYWKPWTYCNGYVLRGFEMLYQSTGDRRYLDYIKRYIDQFVDEKGGLGTRDVNGATQEFVFESLDDMMTGNVLVAMYEHTGDERYKIASTKIRRALDAYPRNPDGGFWHGAGLKGEMWVDGVFMGQMFVLRYGKSIGDTQYCFDEATKQITLFARLGRKGDTGLYYHAWAANPASAKVVFDHRPAKDTLWADPTTGLSPEVWSEGLGWYALILAESLATLPENHPQRPEIVAIFQGLAAALKRTQDPASGRWFQVVDKGDRPDNWTDTSGSAMFVYAIQKGINLGLLDKTNYAPVVASGYKGITANARINEEGLVDVYSACQGLCVQASYDDYIHYPKAVNGNEAVAGFLWATAIVEQPQLESLKK